MQRWIDSLSVQKSPVDELWRFLPFGFLLTVLIETPVLFVLLPKLAMGQKLWYGIWLTACTYPIVVLVLPALMGDNSRGTYLLVAEIFAPLAECWIFWFSMRSEAQLDRRDWTISFAAIVAANLASFAVGEILWSNGVRLF